MSLFTTWKNPLFPPCLEEIISDTHGPSPFFFNAILCEQHRQVNVKTDNRYIMIAFSIGGYCTQDLWYCKICAWRPDCCRVEINFYKCYEICKFQ